MFGDNSKQLKGEEDTESYVQKIDGVLKEISLLVPAGTLSSYRDV